jgi:hypothetical protein
LGLVSGRALAVCLALSACGVDLVDRPGRACDDPHPCRSGRACVAGACVDLTSPDAGGGAGGGSAGGGTANPDAGIDWDQRRDGFASTTAAPGCTVDIDPTQGNRVQATIRTGPDAGKGDVATAELIDPSKLPQAGEGHLRGRFTLASKVAVRGPTPLVRLGNDGQSWLDVGFLANGALYVSSAAQTMSGTVLEEQFPRDGGYGPGDVLVDVSWKPNAQRVVTIDGVPVASTSVTGGNALPPIELRLGVVSSGVDAGPAFTATLSGFQLSKSQASVLGP